MSFPEYYCYKNSGIDWLGDIPVHWEVRRFRHLFRESQEKIEDEAFGPMLSVSGYRGIEVKEYNDENRRRSDEELVGYRIVRAGQLVVKEALHRLPSPPRRAFVEEFSKSRGQNAAST